MTNSIIAIHAGPSEISIGVDECFPESIHGAIQVVDQYDAIEAYVAFADGGLGEPPHALAAYVDRQQQFAI